MKKPSVGHLDKLSPVLPPLFSVIGFEWVSMILQGDGILESLNNSFFLLLVLLEVRPFPFLASDSAAPAVRKGPRERKTTQHHLII